MTKKFTAEEVRAVNPAQAQPLPCPFCGAPAAKNKNPGDRWVYYCPNGHTGYLRHKEWQARAHLAQPAQAVDVVAIRKVAATLANAGRFEIYGTDEQCDDLADKLTRAIGNAQAEGWSVSSEFIEDIQRAERLAVKSKKLNRERMMGLAVLKHLGHLLPIPPTQATPNAHE